MTGQHWSEIEIKNLKKYFSRNTKKELEFLFKKSWTAIRSKAYDLKLDRSDYFWSDEEVILLKEKYAKTPFKKLIIMFPLKKEEAIRAKAKSLNLEKDVESYDRSKPWTDHEVNILIEMYAVSTPHQLKELFPNREARALKIKASRLGIKKDKILSNQVREETNLKKHGVRYISQSSEVQEKIKLGSIEKFGVDHHAKNKEYQKKLVETNLSKWGVQSNLQLESTKYKIKETNLVKYGCENPQQNENIQEKTRQTNLEKYGTEYGLQNEEIRKKGLNTLRDKYNVEHNMHIPEVLARIQETNMKRYGVPHTFQAEEVIAKSKETSLARYGTEHPIASSVVQDKIKNTNMARYQVPYPFESKEIQNKVRSKCFELYGESSVLKIDFFKEKMHQTKLDNGTYGTSKIEESLYDLIFDDFDENVERQYKEDPRYPFSCDFYIAESDCFVELQGYWSHGEEPYNGNNENPDWEEKSENSEHYKNAIRVYTETDPLKRIYASLYNLNFLEIWNSDISKGWDWVEFLLTKQGLTLSYSEKVIQVEFDNITEQKGEFSRNPNQNRIIKLFQPHFYRKERELWNNPKIREKLVENREKYKFKPKEELTNQELLVGFKISGAHIGYSFFSPLWIKAFIEKYSIKSIYDPCMGWGHRLLGAKDITYIGNDICPETYQGNINISEYFNMENKTFYNLPAEDFIPEESYEAVFTCPPYFDTEIYQSEDTSTTKYVSYTSWLNTWWRKVVQNCIVNKPKYFSFVINSKYKEDMRKVCVEEGLVFLEEIPVGKNNKNHFQRSSENSFKGELLLIFEY